MTVQVAPKLCVTAASTGTTGTTGTTGSGEPPPQWPSDAPEVRPMRRSNQGLSSKARSS